MLGGLERSVCDTRAEGWDIPLLSSKIPVHEHNSRRTFSQLSFWLAPQQQRDSAYRPMSGHLAIRQTLAVAYHTCTSL